MEIINKTLDYFMKRYPKRCNKERIEKTRTENFIGQIEVVEFVIYSEYDDDLKEYYFDCECKWCNENCCFGQTHFPLTWEGFEQACEWIDKQRLYLAQKLL